MKSVLKKYWYLFAVILIFVSLFVFYYVCQISVHKKMHVEDVTKAYIYDAEYGEYMIEDENLEKLVELFNDMSGVKREYDGEPGTADNWLYIQLKSGEDYVLHPMGGQKWHVKVNGRELTWVDEFCAENGMDDMVMYIGRQEELHQWYDEMLLDKNNQ